VIGFNATFRAVSEVASTGRQHPFINGQRHDEDFELQTLAAAIEHALRQGRPKKNP
jgi:hypothetical protein